MVPKASEKSSLKRARDSTADDADLKKPRRSQRISSSTQQSQLETEKTPLKDGKQSYLPSPLTHKESTITEPEAEGSRDSTPPPPEGCPSQIRHRTPKASPIRDTQGGWNTQGPFTQSGLNTQGGLSSPPLDTQAFSQFIFPPKSLSHEVDDEEAEGVWGYLVPVDAVFGETLVLKQRAACPASYPKGGFGKGTKDRAKGTTGVNFNQQEVDYEKRKRTEGWPAGGYLIGRHIECDRKLNLPTISNRHCIVFSENKNGKNTAFVEDLSSNGTFVNEAIIGRNKRRELENADEISVLDQARFMFYYPKNRDSSAFRHQYRILQQLGKGHFATVYLCVERSTGMQYAVKRFEKRHGEGGKSQTDGLQQEIGVLKSVSHPNMLCLKDTFDEEDGVYIVLELAPEGELFNTIVMKQKLTEEESRKVFIQLFQGIKYLHERNIVHRDIKPENILLADKELSVKLADFGLAKIIGEESFTTTLCGTPSYVAPEILENSKRRKYTRAVDVWSLGVVLYICLCGFPPFSDELWSEEHPYNLSQQIKMGRFDYPSPYWDSVGDPALDLIDRMLTVDADKRITIDACLEHPWITLQGLNGNNGHTNTLNPGDSTDSLTGAMSDLDFSKRKVARERTLLSDINDVRVIGKIGGTSRKEEMEMKAPAQPPVKIFEKKTHDDGAAGAETTQGKTADGIVQQQNGGTLNGGTHEKEEGKGKEVKKQGKVKEVKPAGEKQEKVFMEMGGGGGDESLF